MDENTRPWYTIDELNAWADEKEKQAWRNAAIRVGEELSSVGPDGYYDMNAWQWLDWAMENVKKAQPEQEPVAYLSNKRQRINIEIKPQTFVEIPTVIDWEMPLYMTPPQRTWVGLTDEDELDWDGGDLKSLVKAIETKLKEKNT